VSEISALVSRARSANRRPDERHEAFGELVRRFQDMAYGCAYATLRDSHLAQDAAQESFIAAWQSLDRLSDPNAFPGWFKRIVIFQCHRLIRGKRLDMVPLDTAVDGAAPEADPYILAARGEFMDCLLEAIETLPEHERVVTTLFYINEYSQKDIAAFLELPVTTIKKRLFSSRKRLRERLARVVRESLNDRRGLSDELVDPARFFGAVESGDIRSVSRLLRDEPSLLIARHDRNVVWSPDPMTGETAVHLAADLGHLEVLELLLSGGAEVDPRDLYGRSPLHCAAAGCASIAVAELLLGRGAELDARTRDGLTPLALAARFAVPAQDARADHRAFAEYLLRCGARIDLFAAAAMDRPEEAKALLEADPGLVHARGSEGETPLHWAALAGSREVAGVLLAHGAETDAKDALGRSPLQRAILPGSLQELPGQSPELGTARNSAGAAPLMPEAWNGSEATAGLLIDRGADVNAVDQDGRTAISVPGGLRDHRPGTGETPIDAESVLFEAAALGLTERVMELLRETDAGVGSRDAWGRTALHVAAWCGHAELCRALLDMGAAVDETGASGETPLHLAAARGRLSTAALLLNRGADRDARTETGRTPLYAAAQHGRDELVRLLLECGADAELPSDLGFTPLDAARLTGAEGVVRALTELAAGPAGESEPSGLLVLA
jgi:RNA polymerase sigma factor (sigma-70 family)